MAKFVLRKRYGNAEHTVQVVETTHTAEELLELLWNDFEDLDDGWEHDWDETVGPDYKVEPLKEGEHENLEVYELGTVEGFFDEPEPPLSADVQNLIAELITAPEASDPAVDEAKRAFVEALSGVLKQVKEPYTEQGDLAEKFWEAGFRYADELLGKWEELEYPEGSQDPTNLGGALKDLWEAAANLHGVDEEGEPVAESFPTYLNEAEDALTDIDPNWRN